jgi:predicted DNA-binding protein (UPF0251 family)
MAPCRRCGKPRPKRRGKQFCSDCARGDHRRRGVHELDADESEAVLRWCAMGNTVSLELCAAALGVSRETARRDYLSAIKKLRAALSDP